MEAEAAAKAAAQRKRGGAGFILPNKQNKPICANRAYLSRLSV